MLHIKRCVVSGRKIGEKMEVVVGDTRIESKMVIKYLGVIIDDRLNFKEHVKYIVEKASVTQGVLKVLTSIMLYACPIWSKVLSVGTTRVILSSVNRLSLIRRISSIRTVFD